MAAKAEVSISVLYVYDCNMEKRPKIRLSRLRDIGWSVWDPIGLLEKNKSWEDISYADEYDGYMLRAAGMLRRKESKNNVIDYLVTIETEHMGLSFSDGVRERAAEVVKRIEDDDQLWNLGD